MRKLFFALAAIGALATSAPTLAAPACRDAHGKFIKCPPAKAKAAARCKDAHGKFAKCTAPGAKPVK